MIRGVRGFQHLEEPLVNFEVGPLNEEFEFLVDTGADKSCLNKIPKGIEIGKKIL